MNPTEIPLFPLGTVLFPGGLLPLKVFEARYLDLIGRCLRERAPFGVVALVGGSEVRGPAAVRFEPVGTLAELIEVDSPQQGILIARCRGTQRFEASAPRQQADGLWLAELRSLPDDDVVAPDPAIAETVRGLATAITALKEQDADVVLEPHHFEDAGWIANRWCELLPIPLAAKQKLMALPDPQLRLRLVDDYLRGKGVIGPSG